MRNLIIDRIQAIEKFKENTHPSQATKSELKRAIAKSFDKEYDKMIAEGVLQVTGVTVNKDELIKLT